MARHTLDVLSPTPARTQHILSQDALDFIGRLAERFESRRQLLLALRESRAERYGNGDLPHFRAPRRNEDDWTVATPPADLLDRRVEITGPAGDTKMVINAFNSGANVYMSDFEDSQSPTWQNVIQGQVNLYDAVRRTLTYESPEGKQYRLNEKTATLMVRPRGLHLSEAHVLVSGKPIAAALFDFGLFFYHNAEALLAAGSGPYFYLPKLEDPLESAFWNDVFIWAQEQLGIPRGSIRATVLIETLPAAFVMEEILLTLREHSAGLNCGRWDYIFSYIKTLGHNPAYVLPDRGTVTMDKAFLAAYAKRLVQICHRRGAHAMGGMAAQIPIKSDPAANERALAKVRADKLREVQLGHDGTWVAHPGLVPIAREIFDAHMLLPNQFDVIPKGDVTGQDLLTPPEGAITEAGLRQNLRIAILYIEPWLRGIGCVPIDNLMEDAATAEISRTQVWQWLQHKPTLQEGGTLPPSRVIRVLDEELEAIEETIGWQAFRAGRFADAAALVEMLVFADACEPFLTIPAYKQLLEDEAASDAAKGGAA